MYRWSRGSLSDFDARGPEFDSRLCQDVYIWLFYYFILLLLCFTVLVHKPLFVMKIYSSFDKDFLFSIPKRLQHV